MCSDTLCQIATKNQIADTNSKWILNSRKQTQSSKSFTNEKAKQGVYKFHLRLPCAKGITT